MCQLYGSGSVFMECGVMAKFVQRGFDKCKRGADVMGYAYELSDFFVQVVAYQLLLFTFYNCSYYTA